MSPFALIVVALPAEARPMIDHWRLKRVAGLGRLECWAGERCRLLISGVGPTAAATATAAFLGGLSLESRRQAYAFNIGWAGSRRTELAKGALCLVNRVSSFDSGREWLPDILFRHELSEASLSTHSRPVVRDGFGADHAAALVDMEAAGFFEAAWQFVPAHRAQSLKVVSDHLEGGQLNNSALQSMLGDCLPAVDSVLDAAQEISDTVSPQLDPDLALVLDKAAAACRFTETQISQLHEWVLAAQLCNAKLTEANVLLQVAANAPPQHKRDRNALVERLRKLLSPEID